ncbi:MAG: hypothetical protein ACK5JI_03595 [Azonexus sp.]
MHLTLLVPELIWPEPSDALTLAGLPAEHFSWLTGRASMQHAPAVAHENALLAQFGAIGTISSNMAQLRALGETPALTLSASGLCADPVHLRFHQERIVLADAGAFPLADAEAIALIDALNAEFSELGRFHLGHRQRWYLELNAALPHPAPALSVVAGRRLDGDIENKTSPLYRWLNEVQMFLHQHPVNAERAARGEPAINSLWLWGEGGTATVNAPFDAVYADDPLARGLAAASGLCARNLPASASAILASGAQRPFVYLDTLLPGVLYENPEDWQQNFAALENAWFAPLRQRLGKTLQRLDLIAPTVYGALRWTLTGTARWQFWKKGRSPQQLAQTLAGAQTPQQGTPT